MDIFTKEEEAALKPFVSSVTEDIFVLKNLPEVIKGALFSRYSRSTKGLRRLLLDEFINNPEVGFKQIVAFSKNEGIDETLAIQKAQDFYDRILDGFGDDSIGELGGAHLALENISNIATKYIQDARIGGSPLEKSSRYVWFNKKIDGEYQFYREPKLMNSKYKTIYIETNNCLFKTYDKLIEPMMEFFRKRIPKKEGTPDRAYDFSIRAAACDALRGLLPASAWTNMGVFGNGRFFEYLLFKMRSQGLSEILEIADRMQSELDKSIPSFVRRCKPGHMFFDASFEFMKNTKDALKKESGKYLAGKPRQSEEVTLIYYDKDAEEKIIASLLYSQGHHNLAELRSIARKMSQLDKEKLLAAVLGNRVNRRNRPPRGFENAYYTFDILTDFGCYRDLQRHRMLTQERQNLTVIHGYEVPQEIIDAGFEEEYRQAMEIAKKGYLEMVRDFPDEAQYVVPFAYRVRWYFKMNARAIYWLTELRSVAQGHTNYRRVAQKMFRLVSGVHPTIFKYAKFVDMNDYSLGRLDSEIDIAKEKDAKN